MNNFKHPGDVLPLTAPSGGVVSGKGYLVGALFAIAAVTVAQGEEFQGQVTGVFDLDKATGQAWTQGQLIYWDNTAKKCTTSDADEENHLIGAATLAAESGATIGRVRLNGTALPLLYEES